MIAIVGRPNVGKSTLFNRLVGMRQAIVDETAGVTRDRHYGTSDWNGRSFSVIDTGGYARNTDDVFEEEIRKQVHLAIDEADVILFMVDVGSGITDFDQMIADILRRQKKPVITVVNKVDTSDRMYDSHQFHALGLGGNLFCISSAQGHGTGDLMDRIIELLPPAAEIREGLSIPHIAIVGKPNVGKSSLTNALLGEERHIVTPVAGTTRDAITTRYNKFGHDFMLIDTAGLRKKGKVHEDLEFYSVMRAVRAIEYADVCILMLDASLGVESQDMSIFNLIIRNKKGCVLVVNKWDTVVKDSHTMKAYQQTIIKRIAPFTDLPIIFTSVTEKQRILEVLNAAAKVCENRNRKISTSKLNDIMLPEIEQYPPPAIKGKYIRIKYITQLPTPVPSFAFFCNLPQYIREDYKRFLENKLRSHFDFTGCPIQIFIRQK
ncbi:MAG: ribosome biogenesis GTPase Der [Bacteroidales bacterium]|nr:ribosome biogenesis GTPase Der [Bacteroidales bacterium]MCL2738366.1 ribosome biogenesis GTPase Der [Bacteroidales bacterium]